MKNAQLVRVRMRQVGRHIQAMKFSERSTDAARNRRVRVRPDRGRRIRPWQGSLQPKVQFSGALQVYDSAGNAIDSTIIIHNDDQMTVQFPIEAAAQSYVVEIMADAESPDMTGTYELVARFGTEPVIRDSFVHGYLSPLRSSRTHQLTVDRSQLFHFIFSADSNSATNDSILTMTVRNAAGESVLELSSRVGDARSATTLLSAGRYSVTIETTYQSAHSTPVSYNLSGAVVDDPLGPRLNDTTEDHFDFDTKRLILATFFPF